MEFAFTEEQVMIRDAVAGFLAEHSTSAAVRAAMASETGYDAALWHTVCTRFASAKVGQKKRAPITNLLILGVALTLPHTKPAISTHKLR